jgi:hypothetical protein
VRREAARTEKSLALKPKLTQKATAADAKSTESLLLSQPNRETLDLDRETNVTSQDLKTFFFKN